MSLSTEVSIFWGFPNCFVLCFSSCLRPWYSHVPVPQKYGVDVYMNGLESDIYEPIHRSVHFLGGFPIVLYCAFPLVLNHGIHMCLSIHRNTDLMCT